MYLIVTRVFYIFLIIILNLYFGSYINNKVAARAELRRGFIMGKAGGLGYPFARAFKYLSKDYNLSVWNVILFFFSFFMWTIIPFSQTLVLIKFDSDLLLAIFFYMILQLLIMLNNTGTYSFIFMNFSRKIMLVFSHLLPVLYQAEARQRK